MEGRERAGEGGRLSELAGLFFKLGCVAFGGPAAHIAMMEDEVVTRRKWLSRQHFLDLIGATNLIPGPNSTEMTMHVGYERAGGRGLAVAGACFILPAVVIAGLLAWAYVTWGDLPEVEPWLYGIKPAVIAVIAGALWKLGGKAVKRWELAVIGFGVAVAVLAGFGEVPALLVGGVVGMVWLRTAGHDSSRSAAAWIPILLLQTGQSAAAGGTAGISLWKLFLFFLKIGSILYGSGYVLVAFLEGGLVHDYGWIDRVELLDAVAIGQLTPGPVLSTSTFIGYLVQGMPGAVVATIGIFLPSFVFVAILNPLIPKLRDSVWLSAFLDAVNVAAVGLMAAVTIELARSTLTSWPAGLTGAVAAVLVLRFKLNAAWLVIGAALAGRLLVPWTG